MTDSDDVLPDPVPGVDQPEALEVEVPGAPNFADIFYPARPRALRPRARLRPQGAPSAAQVRSGEPVGSNPVYVEWLRGQSMLQDAKEIAGQFTGIGAMWQNPFAHPDPRAAVQTASVWFTAYPISMITRPGRSFLASLADPRLWETFQRIGIQALHTGPVKRAGGLSGWNPTPSVDGHFDRIGTHIDELFGSEDDYRRMCEVAAQHEGTVIDDIVPGHTGKGADFRLAELGVDDYPGIYHMVAIPQEEWHLLPDVPEGRDSVNLDEAAEAALAEAGHIIGELQRVIFHVPGLKDTNWSATAPVTGPDGVTRRWVYLHYFKEGQPSINWLDPTFAGMRLVIGDALHSLGDLGSGGLRLDANGFLGVERTLDVGPAWSEGHPLSEAANQLIGSMVRKVGGFTFQELNLSIEDIRDTAAGGADLSYDFVNRPAYHHALATGDTEFLRLTLRQAMELGVDAAGLVHALQNHDEMTYELVHFASRHREDEFTFRGEATTGEELAATIRQELTDALTGEAAPYNLVFTTNGIASTTASVATAALGLRDLDALTEEDVERVRRAHLLLAMFNALQPGVFALSGWDLVGALPVPADEIEPLLRRGDTRWIHRPAYDLLDVDPGATGSASGMPRARTLYGSIEAQLEDPTSFVSRLKDMLHLRGYFGLATTRQVDVPDVAHPAMLVMVHDYELVPGQGQVTVLNFSAEPVSGTVISEHLPPGSCLMDMGDGSTFGEVDQLHGFHVELEGHAGLSLLVTPPKEQS
ncbi:maltose alpha-D-glucosyltransferase [Janibacter terrae]|jgi:trehalose synthase|uniref:Maltose alpha-D-glucosyltransferase n=1 Tax=Janibacter terrae TaxID=103817 RepID=A0ABZ2FCQ1_9MICO|nr:maltose alpha-D-glucosyltransferase [Janibacter terrae]HCE59976.1 maltose alpha-D-glucosyltransferase [Janibacter terrae]